MLFLGRHPFAGICAGKTIEEAIREYQFAYLPDHSLDGDAAASFDRKTFRIPIRYWTTVYSRI
jgi:hypothetical protein